MLKPDKHLSFLTGFFLLVVFSFCFIYTAGTVRERGSAALTPWESVGGCGASSGSVSQGAQLKWIGRGLTGTIIDGEVQILQSVLTDTAIDTSENIDGRLRMKQTSMLANFMFHPVIFDLKLTVPLSVKQGRGYTTGLLGDMALDISKTWGMEGGFVSALQFSFPTGRYEIPVNKTNASILLPELQMGSGLLGSSLRLEGMIDRDWGIINFGASYTAGLIGSEIAEYGYDTTLSPTRILIKKKNTGFTRDGPGAVNSRGTVTPDNLDIFADIGIKTEALVHGFCLGFGVPMRDGAYEEWNKVETDWAVADFPDKESAQIHADTLKSGSGTEQLEYENPEITGIYPHFTGERWALIDRVRIPRPTNPVLSLQYSIERKDLHMPILIGGGIRVEYKDGFYFSGFTGGIGMKFRVF